MTRSTGPIRAAGYCRVSTREQGESGLSLAAQQSRVAGAIRERGWQLETVELEVISTRKAHRPILEELMSRGDRSELDAIVVTRMDRFCRSLSEFAATLERADRHGWALVMLDPAIDMTEPWGQAVGGMAAVFAQLERHLISQRTREGLERARARGTFRPGEHQRYTDQAVIARLVRWERAGISRREMARRLNTEQVPTPAVPRRRGTGELEHVHAASWGDKTIGRILARERAVG